MKSHGFSAIVAVFLVLGITAFAGGGYALYRIQTNRQFYQESQKAMNQAEDDLKTLEDGLVYINDQNPKDSLNRTLEEMEVLKLETQKKVNQFLSRYHCNLTINDIGEALRVAQDARLLGLNTDEFMDWIKQGVESIIANAITDLGPTWADNVRDHLIDYFSIPYSQREYEMRIHEEMMYRRGYYAHLGSLFGVFDDDPNAVRDILMGNGDRVHLNKGDCNKGCCRYTDTSGAQMDSMLEDQCQEKMGTWKAEKCPGFRVEIPVKAGWVSGYTKADISYTFRLGSCANSVFSEWKGTLRSDAALKYSDGGSDDVGNDWPVSFDASSGEATVDLANNAAGIAKFNVSPNTMSVNFKTVKFDSSGQGTIQNGNPECASQ
jgi:hypothetical protein